MKEKIVKQQYYVRNGGSGYNRSFCMSEGLYDASYEHDACGVGMIVNIHGIKSHALVDSALTVLEHMKHREQREPTTRRVTERVFCFRFLTSLFFFRDSCTRAGGIWNRAGVSPRDPSSREEILKVMASEFEAEICR